MAKIKFIKMHGQGNDYLFIFAEDLDKDIHLPSLSKAMSDRHFGAGSDGIVILSQTDDADIKMDIYNADGSLAEMCGTALRCTVYLMADLLNKNQITVLTGSGIKKGFVENHTVTVNMGKATLLSNSEVYLAVENRIFSGYYVSMGNPHFIIFEPMNLTDQLKQWGSKIENHSFFENRSNVEFVEILSENEINVNVWERGSGITLACGTGACASAFISNQVKKLSNKLKVNLPGGSVTVSLDINEEIHLMGLVNSVYHGIYHYKED